MGKLFKIDLIKINLPTFDNSFTFHPLNFFLILSMIRAIVLTLLRFASKGIPKYLIGEDRTTHLRLELISYNYLL